MSGMRVSSPGLSGAGQVTLAEPAPKRRSSLSTHSPTPKDAVTGQSRQAVSRQYWMTPDPPVRPHETR